MEKIDKPDEQESSPVMTLLDENAILQTTLETVMYWLPEHGFSKLILIPDPKSLDHLLPVHLGPNGVGIISDEDFNAMCDEVLCDDCKAKLGPFSIIHTGVNLETGQFDENAFIGLEGGHVEESDDPSFDDDFPDGSEPISHHDLSPKRTLN